MEKQRRDHPARSVRLREPRRDPEGRRQPCRRHSNDPRRESSSTNDEASETGGLIFERRRNARSGDLGLNVAAFHGHWRLCEFLIEKGAAVDRPSPDTGETPLHSARCTAVRTAHDLVVKVLLANGANPNRATRPGAPTGSFMRDCRTRGETPLHRAAAFGALDTIDLLLQAGAARDTRDMNGDTPLGWASWHPQPDAILRRLCCGDLSIRPHRKTMPENLPARHMTARPAGSGPGSRVVASW
jgi:Ankyrin repeats (3 copies)